MPPPVLMLAKMLYVAEPATESRQDCFRDKAVLANNVESFAFHDFAASRPGLTQPSQSSGIVGHTLYSKLQGHWVTDM